MKLTSNVRDYKTKMSHPVRVRGLKPLQLEPITDGIGSHPVRVRGLKPLNNYDVMTSFHVAPRAGAWVETHSNRKHQHSSQSHPVRVRGLKLNVLYTKQPMEMSHPVRVRGLKPKSFCKSSFAAGVAPRAGAWVETAAKGDPFKTVGRTPCGCVG